MLCHQRPSENVFILELPASEPFGGQASAAFTSAIACCPVGDEAYSFSPLISIFFIPVYNCSPSSMWRVVEQAIRVAAINRYMMLLFLILSLCYRGGLFGVAFLEIEQLAEVVQFALMVILQIMKFRIKSFIIIRKIKMRLRHVKIMGPIIHGGSLKMLYIGQS